MDNLIEGNVKKMRVKKGCVAVRVGLEDQEFKRFIIPIAYLCHPLFKALLERAHDAYGYNPGIGPIKLPCSTHDFHHVRRRIEREVSRGLHERLHHLEGTLSFYSC